MYQLARQEFANLKFQFGTSNPRALQGPGEQQDADIAAAVQRWKRLKQTGT
jgi:hypothetical protein